MDLITLGSSVAAVIVVVVIFLRHLRTRDEDCHARQRESQAAFERTLGAVIEAHRESNARVEKKLEEVCSTNRAMDRSLQRLIGSLERPGPNGAG